MEVHKQSHHDKVQSRKWRLWVLKMQKTVIVSGNSGRAFGLIRKHEEANRKLAKQWKRRTDQLLPTKNEEWKGKLNFMKTSSAKPIRLTEIRNLSLGQY